MTINQTPQIELVEQELLSPEEFAAECHLSSDQLDRFRAYEDLLKIWQTRINLVGRSTMPDVWRRHFLDSAQLAPLIPAGAKTLVDLGSGAGFPGLVLALLFAVKKGPEIHLVEADGRKAGFLAEANQVLETNIILHSQRLESITDLKADVITARALSPLKRLLGQSERFLTPQTTCLFLKGERVQQELTEAAKGWTMKTVETASVTHNRAKILTLTEVSRSA